ncbi:MAG: hypothetical protein H6627_00730 [Calditrichae bacterium]|nr:hypothetical protein [Calditrichia bacterium]
MSKLPFFIVLFLLQIGYSPAQKISLEEDISDGYLDEFSKPEAAFILSGVNDPDSLEFYISWYHDLVDHINTLSLDYSNPVQSAHTVFMYLHTTWLQTYALESTTLTDIVKNKEYNCVAATILFNLISEDLNWDVEAFETPTHVYTIFNNFGRDLMVENTSSMGFDIMRNLKNYSNYLASFYPQKDVLKIGLDKLYYYENSNGRIISNTELLGLLAYNRAYLAKKTNNFQAAYDYVLLAQQFNRDSRSNVNFEIGLYYDWGRELFRESQFIRAFDVFADGFYRYPDNEDFRNNTVSALFNSLMHTWQVKDWAESSRLLAESEKLDIFADKDIKNLESYLMNWDRYFAAIADNTSRQQARKYLQGLAGK